MVLFSVPGSLKLVGFARGKCVNVAGGSALNLTLEKAHPPVYIDSGVTFDDLKPVKSWDSCEAYHLGELQIALDSTHPAHILPPQVAVGSRVLDLGCGAGQTMIAAYPEKRTFGVDVDMCALELGRKLTDKVDFCCARAENLPFREESFDLVTARVSLAYTDVEQTLREASRVLKPRGQLWMTLHPWQTPWELALQSNWRGKLFFLYVVVNSLSLHWFQKQFSFFSKRESFQTESRMRKMLLECGFADVRVTRGKHFLVEARSGKAMLADARVAAAAVAG